MHVSVFAKQPGLVMSATAVADPVDDYQDIAIQVNHLETGLLLTIVVTGVTSVDSVKCHYKLTAKADPGQETK